MEKKNITIFSRILSLSFLVAKKTIYGHLRTSYDIQIWNNMYKYIYREYIIHPEVDQTLYIYIILYNIIWYYLYILVMFMKRLKIILLSAWSHPFSTSEGRCYLRSPDERWRNLRLWSKHWEFSEKMWFHQRKLGSNEQTMGFYQWKWWSNWEQLGFNYGWTI
jgi:hypothetical protein